MAGKEHLVVNSPSLTLLNTSALRAAPAHAEVTSVTDVASEGLLAVTHQLTERAGSAAQTELLLQERAQLRQQLADERTAHAIQRATAEQARRVTRCTRSCLEAVLENLAQPYIVISSEGIVQQWSGTLEARTGIGAQHAVGKRWKELIGGEAQQKLEKGIRAVCNAAVNESGYAGGRDLRGHFALTPNCTFSEITLIPLHRIPSCVEAIILLVKE